jgi:dTMP kinase
VNNLLPDLTVLLDLDAELAAKRRGQTGEAPDRLEREKIEFFEAARNSYLELAKAEPQRIFVVDANQSPDQIWNAIQARLDQVLESKGL